MGSLIENSLRSYKMHLAVTEEKVEAWRDKLRARKVAAGRQKRARDIEKEGRARVKVQFFEARAERLREAIANLEDS